METREVSTKRKLPVNIDLEKYDITECLNVLKYIQTLNKQDLKTEEFKAFIFKLECRIKTLVLQKINHKNGF